MRVFVFGLNMVFKGGGFIELSVVIIGVLGILFGIEVFNLEYLWSCRECNEIMFNVIFVVGYEFCFFNYMSVKGCFVYDFGILYFINI